jgi:hypothetical protein
MSSTNYRVLDASDVGTGAVWMKGGGACAVLVPCTVHRGLFHSAPDSWWKRRRVKAKMRIRNRRECPPVELSNILKLLFITHAKRPCLSTSW